MATLQNYKGLQVVSPDPTGDGGLAINNDIKSLVDWNPRCTWDATVDPGVNDDSDPANNYQVGSQWLNTTTDALFVCVDATVGAAVWRQFSVGSANLTSFKGVYATIAALSSAHPSPLLNDTAMVASYSVGVQSISDVEVYYDGTNWKRKGKARLNDIALADMYDNTKPELAAIPTADLFVGDEVWLTNLFQDRHRFEWDGTNWIQKTDWVIECTIRPDGTGNLIIVDDATESPRGIDPVNGITNAGSTDRGFDLVHAHADTTGALLQAADVSPDREMARYGLLAGGNFGKDGSQVEIMPLAGISGRVWYNGTSWEWASTQNVIDQTDGISFTEDTTGTDYILTITHPQILGNTFPTFTPFRTSSLIPVLHSGSHVTQTVLKFRDQVTGALASSAVNTMHFFISLGTSYAYTNSMYTATNACWYYKLTVRV